MRFALIMGIHLGFSYITGRETPRNRPATVKTPPTGHPVAKSRQESVASGTGLERFCELGLPLVSDLLEEGHRGAMALAHGADGSLVQNPSYRRHCAIGICDPAVREVRKPDQTPLYDYKAIVNRCLPP